MTEPLVLPFYQVDAFTDRPFTGNPAGVCVLPAPRPDRDATPRRDHGGEDRGEQVRPAAGRGR